MVIMCVILMNVCNNEKKILICVILIMKKYENDKVIL